MKGDPTSSGQWSTNGDLQVVLNWSKSGLKGGSKWHNISLKIQVQNWPKMLQKWSKWHKNCA